MKILIGGEGGQGVQAVAEILATAGFNEGKHVTYIPNFGVEQRGGVSIAYVIISEETIPYPKFEKADILAVLSDRSIERVNQFIGQNTKIILSPAVLTPISNAIKLESRQTPGKSWNILVMGEINKQGSLVKKESLVQAMETRFARQFAKNPELRTIDIEALG